MKAIILTAFTLITLSVSAQTDSTQNKKQDTIKIGNMVIVVAIPLLQRADHNGRVIIEEKETTV